MSRLRPASWAPERAAEYRAALSEGSAGAAVQEISPARSAASNVTPPSSPRPSSAPHGVVEIRAEGDGEEKAAKSLHLRGGSNALMSPEAANRRQMMLQRGPARGIRDLGEFKGKAGIQDSRLRVASAGSRGLVRPDPSTGADSARVAPDPAKATAKTLQFHVMALLPDRRVMKRQLVTFAAYWTVDEAVSFAMKELDVLDVPDAADYGFHWTSKDEWLAPDAKLSSFPKLAVSKTCLEIRNRSRPVVQEQPTGASPTFDRRMSQPHISNSASEVGVERRSPPSRSNMANRGSLRSGSAMALVESLAQEEISKILKTKYTLDHLISEFQKGVARGDRKYRIGLKSKTVLDCFSGLDAVDWLQERLQIDRERAVVIAEKIWATGRFHHDLMKESFKDSKKTFYKFSADDLADVEASTSTFTRQQAFDINLLIQEKAAKELRGRTPNGLKSQRLRPDNSGAEEYQGPLLWADKLEGLELEDKHRASTLDSGHRGRRQIARVPAEFRKSGYRVSPSSVEFDNERQQQQDELRQAIIDGNFKAIKHLVEKKHVPITDTFDRRGQTVLHVACEYDREDITRFLIEQIVHQAGNKGADMLNKRDMNGWTPLLVASNSSNFRTCALLIKNGAISSVTNDQGTTPLHYIARRAPELVSAAEKESGESTGRSLSLRKIKATDPETEYLQLLDAMVMSAAPNVVNATAGTPQEALINARTTRGDTPLIYATQRGNVLAAKWLLDNGADYRPSNKAKVSAAIYAEQSRVLALMELFVGVMEKDVALLSQPRKIGRRLDELELCDFEIGNGSVKKVPRMLAEVSSFIREVGLGVEGIFRVSPDHMELRSVRARLELFDMAAVLEPLRSIVLFSGGLPSAPSEELARVAEEGPKKTIAELAPSAARGVHITTALYKLFLRELPTALFPPDAFLDCMEIAGLLDARNSSDERTTSVEAVQAMRTVLNKHLSPTSVETLYLTLALLADVAKYEALNKMGASNLATVFGPLLFRPPEINPSELDPLAKDGAAQMRALMEHSSKCNVLAQFMIDSHVQIFSPE